MDLREGEQTPTRQPAESTPASATESTTRPLLPPIEAMDNFRPAKRPADEDLPSTRAEKSPRRETSPAQSISSSATLTPKSSSATLTPPNTSTFHAVNASQKKKAKANTSKQTNASLPTRPLAALAPAPPRPSAPTSPYNFAPRPSGPAGPGKSFYDLPAEIRVQIYSLVLENVTVHILPRESGQERRAPHPLTRVSRVVRNEVLPIIHSSCAMVAQITDFNFSGLLEFVTRIPPNELNALKKNTRLKVQLCTTGESAKGQGQAVSDSISLRRWLQYRADACRPQPEWEYVGVRPSSRVESDIRRRIKRMNEPGKKREMVKLAESLGIRNLSKV